MAFKLPDNIDLNNPEFQNVWNMIQHTHQSIFLTGKAGTGKSTFLKYICANTSKKYVVLAPTGIAAVNVGGQTLHSFFKIPFKPILPDAPEFSRGQLRKTQRYPKNKIQLMKELELIIIDEISMVRADIIDFIDKVLRVVSGNMRDAFGGKQLLFVGDIFQLEPVVTRDFREILGRYYNQFFFFNAHVFEQLGLVPIELQKIYRQTDNEFISILDRVRVSHATQHDLAILNSHCHAPGNDEFTITLATRRDTVDSINDDHMHALKTQEFTYEGNIDGDFPVNDLPTAYKLVLKKGAQVIFIKNDIDGRWVNGTIGKISKLTSEKVFVELEDGETHQVEPELWENIQYTYNEKKKAVEEKILGTFIQLPLKPAWALTVHKSQGLTFNNVIIDFAGGAFTGGQTYVALSRCTSLEGITLLNPLRDRDIIVNPAVVKFSQSFNDQNLINDAVKLEKAYSLYRESINAFNNNDFATSIKCFAQANAIKDELQSPLIQRFIAMKFQKFNKLNKIIDSQETIIQQQKEVLKKLAIEYTEMGNQSLGIGSLVSEDSVNYGKTNKKLDTIAIKSAFANFDKALSIYPDLIEARMGKARLYAKINEPESAMQEYQNLLKLNAKFCEAHIEIAKLHLAEKDIPATIKRLKLAIKADSNRIEPHEILADIYAELEMDDLEELHRDIARKLKSLNKKTRRKPPKKKS